MLLEEIIEMPSLLNGGHSHQHVNTSKPPQQITDSEKKEETTLSMKLEEIIKGPLSEIVETPSLLTGPSRINLFQTAREGVQCSPSIEIRESAVGGGLGMFTTKKILAGEEILRIDYPQFVMTGKAYEACDNCLYSVKSGMDRSGRFHLPGSPPIELSHCGGCKEVYYCSKDCQRKAWKRYHKFECKYWQKLGGYELIDQLRLTVRVLCLRIGGQISDQMWKAILDLEDQPDRIDEMIDEAYDKRLNKKDEAIAKIQALFEPLMQDEVKKIYYRILLNNHALVTAEVIKTGVMMHPFASLVNHSCAPSSNFFADGPSFRMRSTTDIPEDSEITIPYIEIKAGFRYRQTDLLTHYGFLCRCPRCKKELQEEEDHPEDLEYTPGVEDAIREMIQVASEILGEKTALEEKLQKLAATVTQIANMVAPGQEWPEYLEPIPFFHSKITEFYQADGNQVEAFRSIMRTLFLYHRITFIRPVDFHKTCDQAKFLRQLNRILAELHATNFNDLSPAMKQLKPLQQKLSFLNRAHHELLIIAARKAWGADCTLTRALEDMFLTQWRESCDAARLRRGDDGSEENWAFRTELDGAMAELLGWAGLLKPERSFLLTAGDGSVITKEVNAA